MRRKRDRLDLVGRTTSSQTRAQEAYPRISHQDLITTLFRDFFRPLARTDIGEARARFANQLVDYLVADYKAGQIGLVQALRLIDRVARGVGPQQRANLLGELSAKALDVGRPRYLGHRKPKYPRWLKEYAVDRLIDLQRSTPIPLMPFAGDPDKAKEYGSSLLTMVTIELAISGICPLPRSSDGAGDHVWETSQSLLPWPLLHRWYLERMRNEGTQRRRGRPPSLSPK